LSFLSLAHRKQNTHHHSIIAKCCGAHQQLSCHLTRLWATVVPQEDRQLLKPIDALTCKLCKRSFSSRNAIFRHLRGEDADDSECYIKASEMGMQGAKASKEKEILKTAVIRYGYIINDKEALTSLDKSRDVQYRTGVNDIVANRIHDAFVNLTNAVFEEQSTSVDLTTSALSWSTSAKLRQPSLRQDDEVMGAASEVLSFNYRLVVPQTSNQWNDYVKNGKLLEALQAALDNGVDGNNVQIQLHALDAVLPRSTKFYAERGCSQRSYRFLLPIRWLNFQNSDEDQTQHLIEWVKGVTSTSLTERKHQPRGESARAVPECIMKLKQALKAAESRTVPNRKTRRQNAALDSSKTDANDKTDADYNVDKSSDILVTNVGPIRLSPGRFTLSDLLCILINITNSYINHISGRFGQLWRKERRCWSNFCHPELRGMAASPSHDATWRTLDKASIVDIINLTNAAEEDSDVDDLQNVHVVLEFRADGFLLGTIPRLTSTIVAMANGWLPTNFFEVATRPDVYISAPSTSPFSNSMLYFHSPRYHFHELSAKSDDDFDSSGSQFESCIDDGLNAYKWEKMLRSKLLARSSFTNTKDESAWLTELRDVISASVKQELQSTINLAEQADDQASLDEQIGFSEVLASCPEGAYSNTVELLRDIVKNEQWPATSMARSRVIKATSSKRSNDSSILTSKKGSVGTAFPGNSQSSGSFTVINVDLWEKDSGVPLPSANTRFPDLAKAVFDLEREIIDSQTPIPTADGMKRASSALRQPSTHCAVNRVSCTTFFVIMVLSRSDAC
jgi:tRNA U38,U39,U40 pseudouridine synthase TruA